MQESRIDHLRRSLAAVGEEQIAYWNFFDPFSTQLVAALGEYLGDPSSVGLAPFEGDFDFDRGRYDTGCLKFYKGKMVIPLMVRLRNLKDDGDTTLRVRLRCLLESDGVVADFEGYPPVTFRRENLEPVLTYIYEHLCADCSPSTWFDKSPTDVRTTDYRGTAMGFGGSGGGAA